MAPSTVGSSALIIIGVGMLREQNWARLTYCFGVSIVVVVGFTRVGRLDLGSMIILSGIFSDEPHLSSVVRSFAEAGP